MIDEMTCAFDSPGSVSKVFIIILLSRDPKKDARGTTGAAKDGDVPRGFGSQKPVVVGCGVRLGHELPATSLSYEGASSMPIPNRE